MDVTTPSLEAAQTAEDVLRRLPGEGSATAVLHVRQNGEEQLLELPHEIVPLLIQVLGQLANGNGVRIVPVHAELTPQQAADILNVAQPYLLRLLEAGAVQHHVVGTAQRVWLADLVAYKLRSDTERDEALAELTAEAERLGLGY